MVNAQFGNRLVTIDLGVECEEVGAKLKIIEYEDLVNRIAYWDR